eukprot:198875_1
MQHNMVFSESKCLINVNTSLLVGCINWLGFIVWLLMINGLLFVIGVLIELPLLVECINDGVEPDEWSESDDSPGVVSNGCNGFGIVMVLKLVGLHVVFDDDVVLFKPVNRLSGIIPGGNDCNDCMVNNWLLLKWFNSNLRFCVEFINNLLLLFVDEHGIGNVLFINSESRVVLNGKDKQLFCIVSP